MNVFGDFIKDARKKRKLSISQLAKESDISRPYLSQIESGKRGVPSPDILKKISIPLKINYTKLMELAGYINKNDFMINEVKKGIELINELIKNLENDLSYYTAKINNLTSELDKIKKENLSNDEIGQLATKEKMLDHLHSEKSVSEHFLKEMFIEKSTVEEFYHKLQKLVSQREASNEIDLTIIQNEINQLIDENKEVINSLSIDIKPSNPPENISESNKHINDLFFHLQDKDIEKTYKTILLDDHDRYMIEALIEAYLTTKIQNDPNISERYLDLIKNFKLSN